MQDIRGSLEPAFTPASSSKHVTQLIPRAAPPVLSLCFRKHTLKPLKRTQNSRICAQTYSGDHEWTQKRRFCAQTTAKMPKQTQNQRFCVRMLLTTCYEQLSGVYVSTYPPDTLQVTALSVPSKGSTENIVTNYETTG